MAERGPDLYRSNCQGQEGKPAHTPRPTAGCDTRNPTFQLVDVNILGSYFVAREAAKVMQPGASIILIGSMSGVVINVPQPQTPYNFSSKLAMRWTRVLELNECCLGMR